MVQRRRSGHQHSVKVTLHKLAVPGIDLCSRTLLWIARFVGHRIEGETPLLFSSPTCHFY
jgi:hypothetical protein